MKDSLLLMNIYKRYLNVTYDLITILERNYEKEINEEFSDESKEKYRHFREHAHNFIENLNDDLHTLLRLDWELKKLEDKE